MANLPDGFYIDIHTADYDGGEIRGQFVLVPQILLFSTASSSKWKTGTTVPIKFALTDTNGVRILDAQAAAMLSPTCTVKFSASGVQTVAATCMKYDTANHQFIYNWKLGKTPGGETFTITITHPPGNATTTQSTPITISSK